MPRVKKMHFKAERKLKDIMCNLKKKNNWFQDPIKIKLFPAESLNFRCQIQQTLETAGILGQIYQVSSAINASEVTA